MKKLLLPIIFVLFLSSCSLPQKDDGKVTTDFYAMDTPMILTAYGNTASIAIKEIKSEILELDKKFNRKSEDSELYKFNINGRVKVSDDLIDIVSKSKEISDATDGAFDITVSSIMDLWGFYDQNYTVPDDKDIQEKLKKVGYKHITIDGDLLTAITMLDLGGIAKGYASDKAMEILQKTGVSSAILSLGGNILAYGKRSDGSNWSVGIEDPIQTDKVIATLDISDKFVVTSGTYQRFFTENGVLYHHIIDPKTGYPADNNLTSVSVISDSGTVADGLSTGLFVMGLDKAREFLKAHPQIDAVFIDNDNTLYYTPSLDGILKTDANKVPLF
ncbi:MAG: FAD:protein FMN transferase [Clostridia bacterium]|nr:FAD:protein FMN transferase [Clostridia bacterium]